MFKFQYCPSFAFNFISSFSHLNWLGWWYPTVLLGFWRCKNTDFSTGVWSFGVNVSSLRTPRDNNWEILFLCSLIPSSENFYSYRSRGDEPAISSRRESVPSWLIFFSICNSNQIMFCAAIFRFISWRAFGNLLNSSVGTIFERLFPSGEDPGFVRKQENRFLVGLLFFFTEVRFTANRF